MIFLSTFNFVSLGQDVLYSNFSLNFNNQNIIASVTIDSGFTCQGIQLQRSLNKLEFTNIDFQDGVCGNPNVASDYQLVDANPFKNQVIYYRFSFGNQSFTSIDSVVFYDFEPATFFSFYDDQRVRFVLSNDAQVSGTIQLFNPLGKVVNKLVFSAASELDLLVDDLPAGFYHAILIQTDGSKRVSKFLKT